MQRSIWLIWAAGLLLFACSDNDKSDDETGNDSDSSTDADTDTDSDTAADSDTAPTCAEGDGRTIITAGEWTLFDNLMAFTAQWDETTATYTQVGSGDLNGETIQVSIIYTYTDAAAFVAEQIFGVVTAATRVIEIVNLTTDVSMNRMDTTYTFNANGTVATATTTSSDSEGAFKEELFTYSAWDAAGRPLSGVERREEENTICDEMPVTITYDETAHAATTTVDYQSDQVVVIKGECDYGGEDDITYELYDPNAFLLGISDDGGVNWNFHTDHITYGEWVCE